MENQLSTEPYQPPAPVKQSVEIVASFSGKISTGRFENENPFFSIKETWTGLNDTEIESRQKALHDMCYQRFNAVEQQSMVDKITQQRKDLRFYEFDGLQLPSVTSVINWDEDFFINPTQLVQYAARGTAIHKQIEIFLTTGQWLEVKDIPEVYPEYVIVSKGDLGLKFDDVDFRAFITKNPLEVIKTEQTVFNMKDKYAGRTDIVAMVGGKKTIVDIKTGSTVNQDKAFKQLSAYAKCIDGVEQLMVVHLNNKTKQGFSAPILTDKIEENYQMFMKDRKAFRERFGV
jgi:hypothetical protein